MSFNNIYSEVESKQKKVFPLNIYLYIIFCVNVIFTFIYTENNI